MSTIQEIQVVVETISDFNLRTASDLHTNARFLSIYIISASFCAPILLRVQFCLLCDPEILNVKML